MLAAHGRLLEDQAYWSMRHRNPPADESFEFYNARLQTMRAHKALVGQLLQEIPAHTEIHEYGCGSVGIMQNYLIPQSRREGWHQYDISRQAVMENRRHAEGIGRQERNAQQGDYHRMAHADGSLRCIIGLSSWDSTPFLYAALSEVYRFLSGGSDKSPSTFLHIQDLLPDGECLAFMELKEREKLGLEPECAARFGFYPEPLMLEIESVVCGGRINDYTYPDDSGNVLEAVQAWTLVADK
jgi:hypothetical protein